MELSKVPVVEHPWLLGLSEFLKHLLRRSFNFGLGLLVLSFVDIPCIDFLLDHVAGEAHEAFE
jgi:hypothetical protein